MSLWCIGAYLVVALLFSSLYWMSLTVAKKHDEEKDYVQVIEAVFSGD
ncbi:MAG TPA: hypothetical protein VK897_27965 [Anaerolineales bacterium]|nr:hypothetical protein [Anaerolineales bacterium]